MKIFGMNFGSKEAKVAAAIGATVAGETAMMNNAEAAARQKEETPHVEKMQSPERVFMNAKQEVIDAMNETTFDMTSGGKLEGNGWEATVKQEAGGDIVAAVNVNGETKEFVIRADEIDDGKGNIKTVYSMNTGIDRSEEKAMADALGVVKDAKEKGGTIAMNK
jgi:hypothetical protein